MSAATLVALILLILAVIVVTTVAALLSARCMERRALLERQWRVVHRPRPVDEIPDEVLDHIGEDVGVYADLVEASRRREIAELEALLRASIDDQTRWPR